MNPVKANEATEGAKTPLLRRFTPILGLVALCWLTFLINNLLCSGHLNQHGIIPRQTSGLAGILWAPFLHGSFKHLLANTLPLLVLGAIICGRSRSEFVMVTLAGTIVGGALTWLFARNASHIGASGVVFCLFGYLASMAYFRRTFGTLVLSAIASCCTAGCSRALSPLQRRSRGKDTSRGSQQASLWPGYPQS